MEPDDFLETDIQFLEKAFLNIEAPFSTDILLHWGVVENIEAVA